MIKVPAKAAVLTVLLACVAAGPLHAQDVLRGEAAVSYAYMYDSSEEVSHWRGWSVSFARHVRPWFAVVGEANGNYQRIVPERPDGFERLTYPYTVFVHTITGGGRLSARPSSRVLVFGQLLTGWGRASHTSPGYLVPLEDGDNNGVAVQPGAGIDVTLSEHHAVRLETDYRVLRVKGATRNQVRMLAGFAFRY